MPFQSRFSSLHLVRLLQAWAPVTEEPLRQDVPERLGNWLSAFDSVKLDGALQAISAYGSQTSGQRGQPVDVPALEALWRRAKAEMTDLIASKADHGPHHQHYAELQRQMDTRVSDCRARVRQALGKASPRLRQLAALDGVMAGMLGDREHKLLAAVPVYLERRFTHRRQIHQQGSVAAGIADEDDDARRWQQAGGGLEGFQQDMRELLLAELQVRLQPILGLIEAAQEEHRQVQ
jgi:hypothetical protein